MKEKMLKIVHSLRFYTLSRKEYTECMEKMFITNLNALRLSNTIFAVLSACSIFFPLVIERNLLKAGVYLFVIAFAVLLAVISWHGHKLHLQGTYIPRFRIYMLTMLYYTNWMFFSMYIGVWTNPNGPAVLFMGFLLCSLFLFNNPPICNLCLTLIAVVSLIVSSVLYKIPHFWVYDVTHSIIFGCASLIFTWCFTKYRILAVLSASKLEDERNSYLNQSMVDELTQINNRRSFTQTFKRYITHYRETDTFLCLSIIDIDYFKNYNDCYGHPKGDECLKTIGMALKNLPESMNIYAARIGGEEFALLWFEKEREETNNIVFQIQQRIKNLNIPHEKSTVAKHVTVSIGVYVLRCGLSDNTEEVYNSADNALYEAKRTGRNCAVIWGDEIKKHVLRFPE